MEMGGGGRGGGGGDGNNFELKSEKKPANEKEYFEIIPSLIYIHHMCMHEKNSPSIYVFTLATRRQY